MQVFEHLCANVPVFNSLGCGTRDAVAASCCNSMFNLSRNRQMFSAAGVPFSINTSSVQGFQFLYKLISHVVLS